MDTRRRYRNPPIEEALCEFHFDPSEEWDLTIPGKLHSKLGDEYSGKPRQQNVVRVGLAVRNGQPSALQHGERLVRVQLITDDGKRIVGVGPDVVSVHMLRPYHRTADRSGGWEEFRSRIQQTLDAYWMVAKPNGVKRIGVRYLNRIGIPQGPADIGEYLRCALPVVPELPPRMSEYVSRTELSYEDGVRLILSQARISSSTDDAQIVLDLDVIWETEAAVGKDIAMEKAQDLRDRERSAFEAVITDKSRELFDAD